MQHFVYPENGYKRTNPYGTLKVEHDPDDDVIRVIILKGSGGTTLRLPIGAAAMVAGFLLSKQPTIVKGDAMAFSRVTRACDAIPEPDFTVIPHSLERLAPTEGQDGDDDQDVKVPDSAPADTGDLHPDQERRLTALREATGILGGRLSHDRILEWAEWILNGNTGKED